MEIHLIDTAVPAYVDLARLTKKTQIAMESVVPDTREDIGRILSVCPDICLKSKDWNGHGATVSGETSLVVMYLTEKGDGVSFLKTSQSFSMDFDCPFTESEPVLQLQWQVGAVQTRAVNPRKISADYEIQAELTISRLYSVPVSQLLPEDVKTPVHLQTKEMNVERMTSVCERSFSINEQLAFPDTAPQPNEIIAHELDYRIRDQEIVGSRLLLKGTLGCRLIYLPENSQIPAVEVFSVPFSQLIDLGTADADRAQIRIEKTSDYLDLIETIEGQKLLNLEVHAVAQARAFCGQHVALISDAYSNAMPCECLYEELILPKETQEQSVEMHGEEELELPEEYAGLLGVFPLLSLSQKQPGVTMDLLCRDKDGKLFSMKRSIALETDQPFAAVNAMNCRISDADAFAEGSGLRLRATAVFQGTEEKTEQFKRVTGLELDEEKLFDTSAFPSLTAVWPHNETIWELAKVYHSSPEAIQNMNADTSARPVFIPKSL